MQETLNELPEEQRTAFVWNELEGIPFTEIAAITGENVNTLISRKRYAVLYLREKLQALYPKSWNTKKYKYERTLLTLVFAPAKWWASWPLSHRDIRFRQHRHVVMEFPDAGALSSTIVDFWQALGLFALAKILFSGFRGDPRGRWKAGLNERRLDEYDTGRKGKTQRKMGSPLREALSRKKIYLIPAKPKKNHNADSDESYDH